LGNEKHNPLLFPARTITQKRPEDEARPWNMTHGLVLSDISILILVIIVGFNYHNK
jgi:hypothetical protein